VGGYRWISGGTASSAELALLFVGSVAGNDVHLPAGLVPDLDSDVREDVGKRGGYPPLLDELTGIWIERGRGMPHAPGGLEPIGPTQKLRTTRIVPAAAALLAVRMIVPFGM